MQRVHVVRGIGALALAMILTWSPVAAFGAQETKWGDTAEKQLKDTCAGGGSACGRVVAALDVTAVKGGRGTWSRQRTIELFPFRTGGRFGSDRRHPPVASICTDLKIIMQASGTIVSSAPFGDIPIALDQAKISGSGTSVNYLSGNKCRPYNYVQSGSVAFRPDNAFLDTGGPKIRKVTMKVRTRIYMSPTFYVKTGWATDTIDF